MRSLGDKTFEAEDENVKGEASDIMNESLLEEGVSLKTDEINSEEEALESPPQEKITENRDSE